MFNEKMILFLSASALISLITAGASSMPVDSTSQTKGVQLDNDTSGYMQKVNNIYVLEIVSNDPNVLKAEYEAGFIQGRLQKDLILEARDNTWDGLALMDPGRNKSIPPNQREVAEIQNALVRNFNYTLNYIGNQSDAKLRERMTRLVFRLLGVYDGATKSSPRSLDFGGTWLPKPDTFGPEEMALNYETQTISFMDIYFLNAIPDAWDVVDNTQSTTKCSAFVKKTDSEILLAHNSWTCYLDKSMAAAYFINGDYLALNPIPAGIIGSNTDFGYNNKGILFAETTLLATHTEPKVESLWTFLRSALAEQFADSLEEFYRLISLETSGTYMNGYMVVDAKTGEIGLIEMSYQSFAFFKPDGKDGYQVVTRPTGQSLEYDRELLQPDYILGINLPASQAIRDDLKSYDDRPSRRRQFLAQIGAVDDIESAKALITYTDQGDPLSIYGRWDLGIGNTTKPKRVPEGSVDAKAVSTSMVAYTHNLRGVLDLNSTSTMFWMKYGTPVFKDKPFIWSESPWKDQKLRGEPDAIEGTWTLLRGHIR